MTKLDLLTLLLVLWSLNPAVSEVYYITTTLMDLSCPGLCLTISQFARNTSHLLYPNTTLTFLPGTHYLNNTVLTISNVDYFAMQSENSTAAHIECESRSNISFNHSHYVEITNLEFIGCGKNQVIGAVEFVAQDIKFIGQEDSGTALELIDTAVQIVNTTFVSNRGGSYRQCVNFFAPHVTCIHQSFAFIGGAIIATNSTINISQSKFENNRAEVGGAIFAERQSNITMSGNLFFNNSADQDGGVLLSSLSTVTIEASDFRYNSAIFGGVIYSSNSTIRISACAFLSNIATWKGGVLKSFTNSNITIDASQFHKNSARIGGVLMSSSSVDIRSVQNSKLEELLYSTGNTITIEASEFHNNIASLFAGVLYSSSSTVTIGGSSFTNNSSPVGVVIYATNNSKIYHNHLIIDDNMSNRYAVIYLHNSEFKEMHDSKKFIFSRNLGSLMAFNSNITFISNATFASNQSPKATIDRNYQAGGAMTLFQSNIVFDRTCICSLELNHAENGGAIYSSESKIYVNGNVTILHNTALRNGGGAYLSISELYCQRKSTFILFNNTAAERGGGLHAVSSSIKATSAFTWPQYTGTRIKFMNNSATRGGGLSLESNAILYVLKYNSITYYDIFHHNLKLIGDTNTTVFTANRADYGGGVFVDDDSNSASCASDYKTDCFFQVLVLYDDYHGFDLRKIQCIYFSQNHASTFGSTLYGGLLDRCAVNKFAEVNHKYTHEHNGDGISYFKNVTIPRYEIVYENFTRAGNVMISTNLSIASGPVRVCFCYNKANAIEYTHQSYIVAKKGETFAKTFIALDQIG